MCLGDALGDCQAEADACVVGAYALGAALKWLGECGNRLAGEFFAGVLDRELHGVGLHAGGDPDCAVVGEVVDDRVVHEVCGHLQQERG